VRYYFDWDPQKAKANLKKHKVRFEQAASIFLDQREVAKIPVKDIDNSFFCSDKS